MISPEPARSTPGLPDRRLLAADVLPWVLTCLVLILVGAWPHFGTTLYTDSVQYLSVSRNFLEGNWGYTSLINYDAERSFGVVPAPMVTFPLGYPLAIAIVSLTGLEPGTSAFAISTAAMCGTVLVLAWAGVIIGLSRRELHAMLAIFVLNAAMLEFAGSIMTEALFTFTASLGCTLLLRARREGIGNRLAPWLVAGAVIGLSYYIRYAGLFFVVGLVLLAALRSIHAGNRVARGYVGAAVCAVVVIVPGLLRNVWLVGNWRGGNEKHILNPLEDVLLETARGINGVLFGFNGFGDQSMLMPRLLFIALAVGLVLWWVRVVYAARSRAGRWSRPYDGAADLAVLVATYIGCLFYAGLTSVIHYGARMFVPLIPMAAILVVGAVGQGLAAETVSSGRKRMSIFAVAVCMIVYMSLNLISYGKQQHFDVAAPFARRLQTADMSGESAEDAIKRLAGEHGVLVANEGQLLGHLLGMPTVSLVDPHWTRTVWDEQAVRAVLKQYGASVLVVTRPTNALETADLTEFQLRLIDGTYPAWLTWAFTSTEFIVYRPSMPGWL